jgi:hypothetical protein
MGNPGAGSSDTRFDSLGGRLSINLKPFVCPALTCALSLCSVGQQSAPPQGSDASAQSQPQASSNAAQTAQTQQTPTSDKEKSKSIQEIPDGKVAGTSNDRLFYAVPNFLTLQGTAKLPPMSSKDKFKVVALGTFDYFEYPGGEPWPRSVRRRIASPHLDRVGWVMRSVTAHRLPTAQSTTLWSARSLPQPCARIRGFISPGTAVFSRVPVMPLAGSS